MSKRYYWLKLQKDFFQSKDIKVIMGQKDGAEYIIFWLKLLLETIDQEIPGLLRYKEHIPYDANLLSTITDTNISIVKSAMDIFQKLGMIEIKENGDIWIDEVNKLVGSETDSAERVRAYRERKKQRALQCNHNVTESKSIELDIELEKDKDKLSGKAPTLPQQSLSNKKHKTKTEDIPYQHIIDYLNAKTKSHYRHTTKHTRRLIAARWREGFRFDDFKRVIDVKAEAWLNDDKMNIYLRPQTLFGGKFEAYLNESNKINELDQSPNKHHYFKMADALAYHIKNTDPQFQIPEHMRRQWAETFKAMHEKDGRPIPDIYDVMGYAFKDKFWRMVIRSAQAFRKHYSQIYSKWNEQNITYDSTKDYLGELA